MENTLYKLKKNIFYFIITWCRYVLGGGVFIKEGALMITFISPFLLFCCFKVAIGVEDWEQKSKIFVKEQRRVLYMYGQFNKPCLFLLLLVVLLLLVFCLFVF